MFLKIFYLKNFNKMILSLCIFLKNKIIYLYVKIKKGNTDIEIFYNKHDFFIKEKVNKKITFIEAVVTSINNLYTIQIKKRESYIS